jgi:hypothetical protein
MDSLPMTSNITSHSLKGAFTLTAAVSLQARAWSGLTLTQGQSITRTVREWKSSEDS